MFVTRWRVDLVKAVIAEPAIANRYVFPSHAGFEKLGAGWPEVPDLELALQGHQRAQADCCQRVWTFLRDFGEMRGPINPATPHPASFGNRMATEIAKITATNPPQQVKIHYHARCFAQSIFCVYRP